MHRSLAQKIAHVEIAHITPTDDCFNQFDYLVEDFQEALHEVFPSVYACNKWVDKEAQAIAHNDFAHFCVSMNANKVSISVIPKEVKALQIPLRDNWIKSIKNNFSKVAKNTFTSA